MLLLGEVLDPLPGLVLLHKPDLLGSVPVEPPLELPFPLKVGLFLEIVGPKLLLLVRVLALLLAWALSLLSALQFHRVFLVQAIL
jgi:hypothetical protein